MTHLVHLPVEIVYEVALSGYLEVKDVGSLGMTCKALYRLLVEDEYGRDLHYALRGVSENVEEKKFRAALYAAKRGWFTGEGECGEVGDNVWWENVVRMVWGEGWGVGSKLRLASKVEVVGWEEVVLACLSRRDTGCEEGMLAMMLCAAWVGAVRVIEFGLARDLDVLETGWYGETPLHVACENKQVDVVQLLVNGGVQVNKVNSKGATPLWISCRTGSVENVRVLVEAGSDVDKASKGGATPLYVAVCGGHVDVVDVLLGKGGADVNKAGLRGETPLWIACDKGFVELVRALVAGGADVDMEAREGVTPLYAASCKGYIEVVKVLVMEGGADPNKSCRGGVSPLWIARGEGHLPVVRFLIEEGGADMGNHEPSLCGTE